MTTPKRIEPQPGQESVWDYPRPPRVEDSHKHIEVILNGEVIAETRRAKRVLETSNPPVYYFPPDDVKRTFFTPTQRHTYCEFKGAASYYTVTVGDIKVENGAWYYPDPSPGYETLTHYVAIYPSKMDACLVDGERVRPQAGDFYGGWITSEIVGPFKGGPGTQGW